MLWTPKSVAIGLVLTAIVGASCGNPASKAQIASDAATPTSAAVATATMSPDVALPASAQKFGQAGAYAMTFEIKPDGLRGALRGEASFRTDAARYSRIETVGVLPADTDIVTQLFLPPDLYLQQGDGTWFVQSPWNVGVRPGELQRDDPGKPIVDYDKLVVALRDVSMGSGYASEGRTFLRYTGQLDVSVLPALVGEGEAGVARADIWIDDSTLLPSEIQLDMPGTHGFLASINFDYGEAKATPSTPAHARPFRDALYPGAPCTGKELIGCLEAQGDIHGADTCAGIGRRLCIVPLGKISPALVDHLVAYYQDQFGLNVTVLKPAAIPADFEDPKRQQVAADRLIGYMGSLFPDAHNDPQAVLIGLTPIDIYDETSHFRYVFGVKQTPSDPKAIVSSSRMDPLFYGEPNDKDLFFTRTRKIVSKYVGFLYYQLPTSTDPSSAMYYRILGPNDLDLMTQPLLPPGR